MCNNNIRLRATENKLFPRWPLLISTEKIYLVLTRQCTFMFDPYNSRDKLISAVSTTLKYLSFCGPLL